MKKKRYLQIVLIDEATSHIDSASHRRVIQLLMARLPSATLISILHILGKKNSQHSLINSRTSL